jgi:hypothetical protein
LLQIDTPPVDERERSGRPYHEEQAQGSRGVRRCSVEALVELDLPGALSSLG